MNKIDQKSILFFGGTYKGEYENFKLLGFNIIVIVDEHVTYIPSDQSDFKLVKKMKIQQLDKNSMEQIKLLVIESNVVSILCSLEQFLSSYSDLLEYLGINGLKKKAALFSSNKTLMHDAFSKNIGPDSTAKYQTINNKDQLMEFANSVGFPIVLKPDGLYLSLFVTHNTNYAELLHNYEETKKGIQAYLEKTKLNKTVSIQAEEYLSGSNHSVDCIVTQEGTVIPTPIIDVLTGRDIGDSDFHHFARLTPSLLTELQQAEIIEASILGVKALEMTSCLAHAELIYTKNGPKLLEISARRGGNRVNILRESFGIELIDLYHDVLSKNEIKINFLKKQPFAIVTPFPSCRGILKKINDIKITDEIDSYYSHESKANPGDQIGPAQDGYIAPMSIQLKSSTAENILKDIIKISKMNDLFVYDEI